jgi:hypothetical protein
MSNPQDADRLLRAFLDEGPDVLPDWIVDAVTEGIHREPGRAARGSWRNFPMRSNMRTYLAAATVAAAVVAGTALWVARTPVTQPGATATPSPTAEALPSDAAVNGGVAYRPTGFSEPLTFTVPPNLGASVTYDQWDVATFRLRPFVSRPAAQAQAEGAITVHAGISLPPDFCHPGSPRPSPATGVADVRARLARSAGMTVSAEHTLTTRAGEAVSYWDVLVGPGCAQWHDTAISVNPGEHHRIYAIPAPHGTVIVITWGRGYGGDGDDVLQTLNPAANDLVSSLRFD